MDLPEELRYSREHEWVRFEPGDGGAGAGEVSDGRAVVGITDYAQDALGDVVYVQLPDVGLDVVAGASIAEIESTKSVSEVYTPVSGKVAEVNQALDDAPEAMNEDPYGAGWLFALELSDAAQVDVLMDAAAYRSFLEE